LIINFDDEGLKKFKFNRLLCKNNEGEGKFTPTFEKIQNQYTPIFLI
jgi:hypothetical protein